MDGKKNIKPHERQTLEAYCSGPNGEKMRRCQAKSKQTGKQCKKPAVRGSSVCTSHGAGTRKRVKEGTKKPPGRPPITYEYSEHYRGMDLLEALQHPIVTKGTDLSVEISLQRIITAKVMAFEPIVPRLKKEFENLLASGGLDYDQAMDAYKAILRLEGFMGRLQEMVLNIAKTSVAQATIENKHAETKALIEFKKYTAVLKNALRETLGYDQHQAVWERIQDDLKKVRVGMPKEKSVMIQS
jgi:flagellar basal body-associated protein FliL